MEAYLSEPAPNPDPRSSAQDELDAILREAEASRRSRPGAGAAEPIGPAPAEPSSERRAAGAVAAAKLANTVRFERHEIKIPEPGENKIPIYKIPASLPAALALALVASVLWLIAPAGIQLLRPQAVPNAYADASARWTLALTMQRIEHFESEQGRMPQSLDELDPGLTDVLTYQRLPGGGCVLQAPGPTGTIALQTNDAAAPFLAHSVERVQRRPGSAP
jgi:hypothetical protein